MPFTPFHFGAALAVKALARGYFSFLLFGFTQVLIDLESAYFLFTNQWPVHRFFHSYPGATVALAIALLIGKPVCEFLLKLWDEINRSENFIKPNIPWTAAVSGAAIGVYSHVLLDSIMHSDMHPFAPFAQSNYLLGALTLNQLYSFCIYSGLLGIIIFIITYMWQRHRSYQR